MNEQAMFHKPESQYCFPIDKRDVVIKLRVSRDDVPSAIKVIYANKYDFTIERFEQEMQLDKEDRLFKYYETTLHLKDVRLAYVFHIFQNGQEYYYSEDGLTKSYNFNLGYYNFFQLPYINEVDLMKPVEWMKTAVFYQIFVDRFFRGDLEKDDSYINLKWGEKPTSKSFAGGDIKGIIEKLSYIKELGCNVIYLTPIFQSVSNHKYDISDYFDIDPMFGTKEDFAKLVSEAHEMGIRIVLDAVFNHCSWKMKEFRDVMDKGRESKYFDWFVIHGDTVDTEKINYECFASCNYMPKINTSCKEANDYLMSIAKFWIEEYDIDGWRLDVSDEVSHDFWRRFRKEVKSLKPDALIIGENWHDANSFLMGDQYDSIMNYAFTKACLDYFAFGKMDSKQFVYKLNSLLMRNNDLVNEMMLNLLDSHDTDRFFTEVKEDYNKVLAAMAISVFFPGATCVYYGTEVGTDGGYDPDNRRTFDWEHMNDTAAFRDQLSKILRLKSKTIFQQSTFKMQESDGIITLQRVERDKCLTFIYNGSGKKYPLQQSDEPLCENRITNNDIEMGGYVIYEKM